eukprot:1159131-Pelagomonas_calceolata.AAC.10
MKDMYVRGYRRSEAAGDVMPQKISGCGGRGTGDVRDMCAMLQNECNTSGLCRKSINWAAGRSRLRKHADAVYLCVYVWHKDSIPFMGCASARWQMQMDSLLV